MNNSLETLTIALQHHKAGRLSEAEQLYHQILQQYPDQVGVLELLGGIAKQKDNYKEASTYYRKVLALNPNRALAHSNLGLVLYTQGKLEQAAWHYRQAITLQPNKASFHQQLGRTLRYQNHLELAKEHYRQAIALDPNYAKAYHDLACTFDSQRQFEQAIVYYEQALQLKPDEAEFHWNLSLALLKLGDFNRGFAEYEWRWRLIEPLKSFLGFSTPPWDGSSLQGKTILLHAEQGLGDALQFIRYAPLVKELGCRVIVACNSSLVQLFSTVAGIDQVVDSKDKDKIPEFDTYTCLMSLPHLLGTTLKTIPINIPYLFPPQSHHLQLEDLPGKRLKVGIVWTGKWSNVPLRKRSSGLESFLPVLKIPDVAFYSFQVGPASQDLATLHLGIEVQDLSDKLLDFTDTAAVIAQLDLLISIDTSVAHLAGAMGKPTWIVLHSDADWRWLIDRCDSPWYPSVRLFRQQFPGDWDGVFRQVSQALQALVKEHKSTEVQSIPPLEHQDFPVFSSQFPVLNPQFLPNQAQPIGITWQLNTTTSEGIIGMYLALEMLRTKRFEPVPFFGTKTDGNLNPLHKVLLRPMFQRQQSIRQLVVQQTGRRLLFDIPVLHVIGSDFSISSLEAERIIGKPTVGLIVFEDTHFSKQGLARAKTYDVLATGSSWNEEILKGLGLTNIRRVPHGIDPTIFHPAPKSNLFGDRFVIFSGGKLEYRKGQDIVIAAFKQFQERHPEALLLTAWDNYWSHFMTGLEQTGNVVGLPEVSPEGRIRVASWLIANELPTESFIDIGLVPNHLLAQMIREADVAVFPNRCEGGTNIVAMETLACGIPTILSANTGHLDLIRDDNCYALRSSQCEVQPTHFTDVEGWGESDVEEVVETLEQVYTDREEASRRGYAASRFMQDWTWSKQIHRFLAALE